LAEVAGQRSQSKTAAFDVRRLDRILAEHLGQFGETMREDVTSARAALSKLLVGRVLFQPTQTEVGGKLQRTYRLEAHLAIGRLLVSSDGQEMQPVRVPDGI
jgi:hypothetical protein